MKIKNQWLLDQINDLIQLIYTYDFMQKNRSTPNDINNLAKIHDELCNTLFSMLWVSMGENIPKRLYKVNDYSVLYGIIADNDEIEIED